MRPAFLLFYSSRVARCALCPFGAPLAGPGSRVRHDAVRLSGTVSTRRTSHSTREGVSDAERSWCGAGRRQGTLGQRSCMRSAQDMDRRSTRTPVACPPSRLLRALRLHPNHGGCVSDTPSRVECDKRRALTESLSLTASRRAYDPRARKRSPRGAERAASNASGVNKEKERSPTAPGRSTVPYPLRSSKRLP